jgi:hypothetical protein
MYICVQFDIIIVELLLHFFVVLMTLLSPSEDVMGPFNTSLCFLHTESIKMKSGTHLSFLVKVTTITIMIGIQSSVL